LIFETPKNIPIDSGQNIPLALLGQCVTNNIDKSKRQRRYNKAQVIETIAVSQYRKNGKGITYKDLLSSGVASNKEQARVTLKYCVGRNILFTLGNYKPQQYYPVCLKSEISKKNIPIGVTGVRHSKASLLTSKPPTGLSLCPDPVIVQTLEGYVLPLLPQAPLHIHKMQFKVKVSPEYYHEIAIPVGLRNGSKQHEEIIGRVRVRYCFYANGTVMVFTESSNAPLKLEDEVDLSRLIAFFGQVRDRLVVFLADKHERIVPDIMQWELTQWDVNKDVKVNDNWAQITGLKIQIKYMDHLFRVYIKSMGKDTVCRVEESCYTAIDRANVVETIAGILNPTGRPSVQKLSDT
jgi:hypothetical protein